MFAFCFLVSEKILFEPTFKVWLGKINDAYEKFCESVD